MFDIGLTEILLVFIVALLVIGPKDLPSMVRTLLLYVRKIRSGFNNIRDEVERELDLDAIKHEFDSKNLNKIIGYDELQDSLDELKKESQQLVKETQNPLQTSLTELRNDAQTAVNAQETNSPENPSALTTSDVPSFDGNEEADTPEEPQHAQPSALPATSEAPIALKTVTLKTTSSENTTSAITKSSVNDSNP